MTLDRRAFLRTSGTLLGAPALFVLDPRGSWTSERKKTLIVFFLRGGADGLNLVVPHGDAAYYELRSSIAIARPGQAQGALDLDGFFGLHPAAQPLLPLFQNGTAVALHAVGHPENSRSHFEEQDVWETGVAEPGLGAEGWLNRHLQASEGAGPIRAVALGGRLPRILRGKAPALAIRSLNELAVGGADNLSATLAALKGAYATGGEGASDLLAGEAQATLEALRELESVAAKPYETDVAYPDTDLGRRAREAARLIKADVGLEVVELDLGGWDTHQNQGGATGPYADRVRELTGSIAALCADLEERLDDVLVLTLSEFGRTAAQNGTNGTDHGWASCLFAAGGAVRAKSEGKPRGVLGKWPGLAHEQLNQRRDLALTTDFRDVVAEMAAGFLATPNVDLVLPGRETAPVGLI